MQITPDGDYTQTGVEWNKVGYANPVHSQYVAAPERSGLYYFRASTASGRQFAFPWVVAPAKPTRADRGAGVEHHLERLQQLRRPQQLHPRRRPAADADRQRAGGAEAVHRRRVRHLGRGRTTRRCRSTGPSRSTTSTSPRRSPTRSRAGRRATSPRPSGGCSAGWSAQGFAYDFYAETQLDDGTLDLVDVPRAGPRAFIPSTGRGGCTSASSAGCSRRAAGSCTSAATASTARSSCAPDGAMICHNGKLTGLSVEGLGGHESRFAMRHESEANLLGVRVHARRRDDRRAVPRGRRRRTGPSRAPA